MRGDTVIVNWSQVGMIRKDTTQEMSNDNKGQGSTLYLTSLDGGGGAGTLRVQEAVEEIALEIQEIIKCETSVPPANVEFSL